MPHQDMALVMTLADAVNKHGLVVVVAALADMTYAFAQFHGEPLSKGFWRESGNHLHDVRRLLCKLNDCYCVEDLPKDF